MLCSLEGRGLEGFLLPNEETRNIVGKCSFNSDVVLGNELSRGPQLSSLLGAEGHLSTTLDSQPVVSVGIYKAYSASI